MSESDSSSSSAPSLQTALPPASPAPRGAERPALSQRQSLFAILGICAVVMLVALDSTIVATILPKVTHELGGMALYAWVGTGYLLSSAIVIPIFGRIGDLFGRKRFVLISIVLVALGSISCGLAQSMAQLILARTLQGIGGGMMIATAFAASVDIFPDAMRRVKWQALTSTSYAVASGLGPMLGGGIAEEWGWRAAFFVTPCVAVPAFLLLLTYFPHIRPSHERKPRIDWLGGGLMALAVGAPMAALELGFSIDSKPVLGLVFGVLGALALMALVRVERRIELPMFPLRVLDGSAARLLNVISFVMGSVMFNLMYYGPLFLQVEVGFTPYRAGLILAPFVACIPIGSVVNGRLFSRLAQPQYLMVMGSMVLAVGCAGVMMLERGSSMALAIVIFGVSGFGLGFVLPNLTLFAQIVADPRDVGVASALIQTTRTLGSAVGTAVIGLVINRTSVLTGLHTGMVLSMIFCVVTVVLARRIRLTGRAGS